MAGSDWKGTVRASRDKGNALSGLGRRDEALSCYDRALEIDSGLARAWYNKGDELGHLKRFIEAKACFENARGKAPAGGWDSSALVPKVNASQHTDCFEYPQGYERGVARCTHDKLRSAEPKINE